MQVLMETYDLGNYDLWHLRQMLQSKFCFAPAGWGWGMRAPQTVIMGCIPVVIQVGCWYTKVAQRQEQY